MKRRRTSKRQRKVAQWAEEAHWKELEERLRREFEFALLAEMVNPAR